MSATFSAVLLNGLKKFTTFFAIPASPPKNDFNGLNNKNAPARVEAIVIIVDSVSLNKSDNILTLSFIPPSSSEESVNKL